MIPWSAVSACVRVQRVQIIRFSVRAMGCVFLRVNCVMATRSAATTAMSTTVLALIVSTGMRIKYCNIMSVRLDVVCAVQLWSYC